MYLTQIGLASSQTGNLNNSDNALNDLCDSWSEINSSVVMLVDRT